MSRSQQLLREVKEDVELEKVNGGCSWYMQYADYMNIFFGSCHSHTFCYNPKPAPKPPSYPTTWNY